MSKRYLNTFLLLSLLVFSIILVLSNPKSISDLLTTSKSVVDILSPVGIFIIGYLGLIQWKEEIDFKKKNELSEEIFQYLLAFVEILELYRNSWADMYSLEGVRIGEDDDIDNNAPGTMLNLNIRFNPEQFQSRIENLNEIKYGLEKKLKEASLLWNDAEIKDAGKDLFSLYSNFEETVFHIDTRFENHEWIFEHDELETNEELQLIYNFKDHTRNKSIEELNSIFQTRLEEGKNKLLGKISKYFSPRM